MTVPTRIRPADLAAQPLSPGRLSRQAFDTGDIELRYYAPNQVDRQVPHERNELYFVASGAGTYVREGERLPFRAGDVLFAAAGEAHRFEDFTGDFAAWVLFYGPTRARA